MVQGEGDGDGIKAQQDIRLQLPKAAGIEKREVMVESGI